MVITAGSFDLLAELVCEDDDHLLEVLNQRIRVIPGVAGHRDLRLPEAAQADLRLGNPMTTTPSASSDGGLTPWTRLADAARDHLWMHFTRHVRSYEDTPVPIIVRGEGALHLGRPGRATSTGCPGCSSCRPGTAATSWPRPRPSRPRELAFFPLWSYAHPKAIELAERLAGSRPGDLNRVFFTTGGGEAVETAWKLAKQYFKLVGKPTKHKVISRAVAYHGTTQGALSITGIPAFKQDFEPLVPGAIKVPNTNFYRAPDHGATTEAFGRWAADQIEQAIQFEGPDTVAAVFLEPVQNSGGCFPPPPGYFQRVREICDRYDVLLVSDEVICAFGRLGTMFACDDVRLLAGHHHLRQGHDLGLLPDRRDDRLGPARRAVPARARRSSCTASPSAGTRSPAAVALANLDLFEREDLHGHVAANEGAFRATLEKLLDLPIVGDVRGDGYFYGIELVKDKATRETFDDDESERLLRGFLSRALFEAGLYCRADDRGDPVVQLRRR